MVNSSKAEGFLGVWTQTQKRFMHTWFDFLGGAALPPGMPGATLWRSNLELLRRSTDALWDAQRASGEAVWPATTAPETQPTTPSEVVPLALGATASVSKVIGEEVIALFAQLSGDVNPVHLEEAYAKKTRFGGRIAHGMLSAGLISAVLGTKLPGPGAVYLSQSLKFLAPVMLGDEVTATATVIGVKEGKPIYTLATVCTNQKGERVLEGEAVILYEPVESS